SRDWSSDVCSSDLFGRTPQQLVAYGEGRDVLRAHFQFADAAYRDVQGARSGNWGQRIYGGFLGIRNYLGPFVVSCQQRLDFRNREVFGQLQGQGLRVRAHRTNADAQSVHHDFVLCGIAQDLVGLDPGLPLFLGLAVAQICDDPRDQRAGQWHAERGGVQAAALCCQDFAVDLQDRWSRMIKPGGDVGVDVAELGEQFAHVAGTATG